MFFNVDDSSVIVQEGHGCNMVPEELHHLRFPFMPEIAIAPTRLVAFQLPQSGTTN